MREREHWPVAHITNVFGIICENEIETTTLHMTISQNFGRRALNRGISPSLYATLIAIVDFRQSKKFIIGN